VSFAAYIDTTGADTTISEVIVESESENLFTDKHQKLQSDLDDEDEDNGDSDHDISNQDDDLDAKPELTPVQELGPDESDLPIQPAVDQNRPQIPGSSDSMPQPDYSAVSGRGYPQTCHSGQYQCQKTDPTAPTRCIPQEWRCNGMRDCENSDDESGCSTDQLSRGRSPHQKCTQEQYQCHGTGINSVPSQCIESRHVCDGTYHCSYGDDEANCGARRDERREDRRTDDRRDDRREPHHYPNYAHTRRYETAVNSNDQTVANRAPDPVDRYRPQPPAQPQPNDRKSEEYVQRLEWRDRCFRSCLKY